MRMFRYNGGRVACENFRGLVEAAYTGPMTAQAFDALRTEALHECSAAQAFVVRLDKSLIAMQAAPVEAGSYSANDAPGAMIVRPDQFAFWSAYARRVAQFGVMRSVWLESHARLAYEWANRQISRAELPRLQQ